MKNINDQNVISEGDLQSRMEEDVTRAIRTGDVVTGPDTYAPGQEGPAYMSRETAIPYGTSLSGRSVSVTRNKDGGNITHSGTRGWELENGSHGYVYANVDNSLPKLSEDGLTEEEKGYEMPTVAFVTRNDQSGQEYRHTFKNPDTARKFVSLLAKQAESKIREHGADRAHAGSDGYWHRKPPKSGYN